MGLIIYIFGKVIL